MRISCRQSCSGGGLGSKQELRVDAPPTASLCQSRRTEPPVAMIRLRGRLHLPCHGSLPDSGRERFPMRPKAGYSMIGRRSPSIDREAPTGPSAHSDRQRGSSLVSDTERTTRGRTSTPGSQAIARSPIRQVCTGKPRHPPCRSPHGRTPRGRSRGEANTELHAEWSCGRSQTSLYNPVRRHSTLDYLSPVQFERLAG